jgi:hypothetical protein
MKSKDKLTSFIEYCHANPTMRFWQALRNWSGYAFIFGSNGNQFDDYSKMEDTFYIE